MQQKLGANKPPLFVDNGRARGARPPPAELPFRCPRCGEHQRFRSLASLRAHLEYSHAFHGVHDLSLPSSRGRCNTDTALLAYSRGCKTEDMDTMRSEGHKAAPLAAADSHRPGPGAPPRSPPPERRLDSRPTVEAHVRMRLEGMLRAADSSMERRLRQLSAELVQTEAELLCEHAHTQHLAQERQEVYERGRALSRQVDAAVMVIATLREQLSASEHELQKKEQRPGSRSGEWRRKLSAGPSRLTPLFPGRLSPFRIFWKPQHSMRRVGRSEFAASSRAFSGGSHWLRGWWSTTRAVRLSTAAPPITCRLWSKTVDTEQPKAGWQEIPSVTSHHRKGRAASADPIEKKQVSRPAAKTRCGSSGEDRMGTRVKGRSAFFSLAGSL
ncbi:protein ZNF365 isoform X2 [Denticeps clupeoides]|uniref:protein ZNF365 isoform X2 n=1 Tax=Denticeps clupeoides TaxID=299321 RepID=UPI0010A32E52|nr:protein ZNF365 isoform X2 [Denticeps clupeoides]